MIKKCRDCGKPIRDKFERCYDCNKKYQDSKREIGLPKGYLSNGYFDEQGNLRRELITDHAKVIAEILSKPDKERIAMTSASLRKFFGKVKLAQRKLEAHNDFQAIIPDILSLEPYVNNAVVRGVVPEVFQNFIEQNVELAVGSSKAFSEGFAKHFEYVVAFFPRK